MFYMTKLSDQSKCRSLINVVLFLSEIKCRRQQFNNADITGKIQAEYRYNDRVQYNCKRGYEGSFTLTCKEDGWHRSNECTGKEMQ